MLPDRLHRRRHRAGAGRAVLRVGDDRGLYLHVLHALVQRHGAPLALYSVRWLFTKSDPEDTKPTQFQRALLQLDIEPICAHSQQAKGRLELLFQTLQDRLRKTMRLAGIDTMEQANSDLPEYLRGHGARFAVQPHQPQDMHRPWTGSAAALADICALHHQRQLSAQGACKFEGSILQLLPGQLHAPKARAMGDIAQHANGTQRLGYCGRSLAHRSDAFGYAQPPGDRPQDAERNGQQSARCPSQQAAPACR